MATITIGILCVGLVARAVVTINIDVSDLSGTYEGTGAAPDAGTFWNAAGQINTSYTNLTASDGVSATTVGVTFSGFNGEYNWSGALPVNDRFYGPATGTAYVEIDGLEALGSYDLFVYASYWDATFSVDGLPSELADPTSTSAPWVEGNQYVRFEHAIADNAGSITLAIASSGSSNGQWTNIGALQIVEVAVIPEPGEIGWLFAALAGFPFLRRRR